MAKQTAYIGMGSNVGEREAHLRAAVEALRNTIGLRVLAVSRFYETAPLGGPPGQGDYLNAVCAVAGARTARELLERLLAIEAGRGRARRERWGPRTLDLDLLLFGDAVIDEPGLNVPHPCLHERAFVIEPLAAIAPDARHPLLNKTAATLWEELQETSAQIQGAAEGTDKQIATES